ncbi:neuronal acetylcholine receptor subunit alpha-3-like isoform X2 [Clytia hemisphaerica]
MEKEIHEYIFDGMNKDIRPEIKHGVPTHVHFDMKLQKIVNLDVKHQQFVVNTFIKMRWVDPQLRWNKTKYEGIESINVGSSLIWTPDIVLYNAANEDSFAHTDVYKTKALVSHTGEVLWSAPVMWRVSCEFDITWFPLDRQECTMKFGSWSYMNNQMRLSLWYDVSQSVNEIGHSHFMVKSGEWDINDVEINQEEVPYPCCQQPFSTIQYTITLNRMVLYYFLYIIMPLVSQILVFFCIFHIPYGVGDRMSFGVTILLGITVYLLVISEKLPEKSDNKPMLGLCFIAEFYILSISLIFACLNIKLASKTTPPPVFLLHLCSLKDVCHSGGNGVSSENLLQMAPMHGSSGYLHGDGESQSPEAPIVQKKRYSPSPEQCKEQWEKISLYLDRVFFYVFCGTALLIPLIVAASLDRKMLGVV